MPFLKRVELHREALVVLLAPPAHEVWSIDPPEQCLMQHGILTITSPVKILIRGGRTACVHGSAQAKARSDKALIAGLRRAHAEFDACGINMRDARASFNGARGIGDPYLRRLVNLAFLAPDIQRAILERRQPAGLKLADLLAADMPLGWIEQRELLGF